MKTRCRIGLFVFSVLAPRAFANPHDGKNPAPPTPPAVEGDNSVAKAKLEVERRAEAQSDALEKSLVANTLAFWSLARGQDVPKQVGRDAALNDGEIKKFRDSLGKNEKLSPKLLASLRKDFEPTMAGERLRARRRFLGFSNAYQKAMPAFAEYLPEILTVWGEARNLEGFTTGDSLFLQAKMASVIHVLRNRQASYCGRNKALGKNDPCKDKTPGQIKWQLATRRFQFSAFEPYDPNLGELALGPKESLKLESIDSLPALDQRALLTLARTLIRLDQKKIRLPAPIGNTNTRHYITPTLVPYSKELESQMQKTADSDAKRRLLRVPASRPRYLTVVPKWATPESLVADPTVLVENPESQEVTSQEIPPKDFLYFQGLL